ncbi:L-tyrosine 3-hydroxylase [Lentzea sp. NEAU-D7]|uniref:L-tyrosine 3-hydroxylase n=1 Tax=Lentzea sp. NEAU-D7 TaxID=2994667 RepID=UPI00224B2E71|nr:L-tyrosine 3-hydroxylase [Lentzea sp. NEAU-D7]MCX2954087.1 L-tyrosine 3-hydroxylase [Lentzea sp. NEAU-D7]
MSAPVCLPRWGHTWVDLPVLRLPMPGADLIPCATGCFQTPIAIRTPEDPVEQAVHRWFLGHHGAFLVWRFLSASLDRLIREPDSRLARLAALGYDAYSVMLAYSGSCSREVYEDVIRPMMVTFDPAFSGRWARDYEPLPGLLRRARAALGSVAAEPLTSASKANLVAHMEVMRRLVPDGPSLLRESGRARMSTTDAERARFDEFFLVSRENVCVSRYRAHRAAVLSAIGHDLAKHPLRPEYGETLRTFATRL